MSAAPAPGAPAGAPPGEPGVPAELWLRQPAAVAGFAPSAGFCCTAFRVRTGGAPPSHAWWPVLAEPPSWEALRAQPAFYGNPLLFPFPMAISGGRFSYRAREYTLPPSRGGRVVHGLVRDAPWTVERHWQDDAGDHLRAAHGHAGGMVELAPGATWRPWARITAERSRSVRDG
jgi:hypothetical protein